MMPTRVALFPYDERVEEVEGIHDELMLVASALQIQITRDVAPIWGVSAVVSAFSSLELVPPGCLLIGLTSEPLPLNRTAFHFSVAGQPAALIEYRGDWSTAASHELIEMLVDPTATKTVTAKSLADEKLVAVGGNPDAVVKNVTGYKKQGLVPYLMELCDPCEQSNYEIGAVHVSDFVTPEFYGTDPGGSHARYSFTGRIDAPLQLLPGGYITWSTQDLGAYVFQAFGPGTGNVSVATVDLEIERVDTAPSLLSRPWIDAHDKAKGAKRRGARRRAAPRRYVKTSRATRARAVGLRQQMGNARRASGSPATLGDLLTLVRKLATDHAFYIQFTKDPAGTLAREGIPVPPDLPPRGKPLKAPVPSQEAYQTLLNSLEQAYRIGYNFTEPNSILWAAKLPGG
jgi:hypothetical protein